MRIDKNLKESQCRKWKAERNQALWALLGILALAVMVASGVCISRVCASIREGGFTFIGDGEWAMEGPPPIGFIAQRAVPQRTPDGKYIVTTVKWNSNSDSIYLVKTDGSDSWPLFEQKGEKELDLFPSVSPDGSRIVYSTSRHTKKPRQFEIESANIDGSNRHRLTRSSSYPDADIAPSWSPDGTKIAYSRGSIIYTMESIYTIALTGATTDGS